MGNALSGTTASSITVSVIMPVKDTRHFLSESVGSVLDQSLTGLELVCVDDGSQDGSLDWLRERAATEPRMRVLEADEARRGPGGGRNRGLEVARGEYVAFLDSDDLLRPGALESLVGCAASTGADIAIGGISKFSDSQSRELFRPCTYLERLAPRVGQARFNWRDVPDLVFELRFVCWNKLFKRSFIESHEIRFPEGVFYEDLPFFVDSLLHADAIALVPHEVVANRRFREGATTFVQGARAFDAIGTMRLVEERLSALADTEDPVTVERLIRDFEVFRFRRLVEYLHKNDAAHLEPFFRALQAAAQELGSEQVESLPPHVQAYRERILTSSAVEVLAFEAWDARTTAARLAREKRTLQRRVKKLKSRLWDAEKPAEPPSRRWVLWAR